MKFTLSVAMCPAPQLLPIAVAAEQSGWYGITLGESVFYPEKVDAKYPYTPDGRRFWGPETPFVDPWVAIPAMAAVTQRLFFHTSVNKLPLRNPLLVAKTVGSAAALSGVLPGADGRALVFSLIVNGARAAPADVDAALDEFVSALGAPRELSAARGRAAER